MGEITRTSGVLKMEIMKRDKVRRKQQILEEELEAALRKKQGILVPIKGGTKRCGGPGWIFNLKGD